MVIPNDRLFISTNGHTDFSSLSMVILNDTDFSSLPMVISSHTDLQLLLIIPNQINSPLLLVGPDHTKSSLSMVIPNQTDSPVSVVSPDHTKSLLSMVIPNHTDPPSYQCSFSVHSQAHCKLVTVFFNILPVAQGHTRMITLCHRHPHISTVVSGNYVNPSSNPIHRINSYASYLASNWILMSCQPHRVTSGQSNSGHKQTHISKFFDSSADVWESRWPSWAVHPNEPSGFRGRKDILNHASALVTTCP